MKIFVVGVIGVIGCFLLLMLIKNGYMVFVMICNIL